MNPHNAVNVDDEQFTLLLARYSEAWTAGGGADPAADLALPAELRQRLQRALDCLRRLRQFRPRPAVEDAVTRIMETDVTLHDDDMVGRQLGRFQILRTLGFGGGGIVYLAFDPELRREVALKIPHLTALLVPDLRRRFLREARAAARLDHPNLVPVHEVGESDGMCFLVSAYCCGGSLADWLKQRTEPVPVRQAAELLAVLADAVQYVHGHGIYHRDIKPSNILLDPNSTTPQHHQGQPLLALRAGEWGFTPRLTDFGLAKQLNCDSGQTVSGTLLGTPSYMAPEQLECRPGDIGPRTDVYGLGAVLYELLTGRPPFKGATDAETLDRVLHAAPARPRQLRSPVPRDLETICLKCLTKWPEHRYASAAELADELRRFRAGEPIQARPPGVAERLVKWIRRHPWGMILGCFIGLAVLALLGGGFYLYAMKRTHDDHLEAAAKRHEEHQESIRQKEQNLRQYHYAAGIALARGHWGQRRLDELANQLRMLHPPAGARDLDDPRDFEWHYLSRQASTLRWQERSPDRSLLCLAFSPDGTACATGHGDRSIRLWDRASGRMRQILPGHRLPIRALAYSRDGKYLISGDGDDAHGQKSGELRLWNAESLKLQQYVFPTLASEVHSLAFSPDGRALAAALTNNTVKLWNNFHPAANGPGSPISIPIDGGIASVAFHPNNSILAIGRVDGKITLHDAADGCVHASWRAHPSDVLSLAYSRANGLLISGGKDGMVRLWGRDSNRLLSEYRHDDRVFSVAFSPDDRTAASLSQDGIVKLWDINERRESLLLAMPPGWGRHLAFSPDGKDLAVGKQDGKLWMCDLSHATEATSWLGHRTGLLPREAWAVAFSPDGKTLASAGDDHMVRLWDPASGRERGILGNHRSLVTCIAFSPDSKLLATGSFDPKASVKIWNTTTGAEVATLKGHLAPVDALVFAPDGKILVTAGRDKITRLWDIATRKDRPILSGTYIQSLAFSPDGRTLALAGDKSDVYLWDVESEQVRRSLEPHPAGRVAVAFSPDSKTLASGDTEGTVRFWDVESGSPRASIRTHTGPVNCLAFTPDGKTLASASFDRTVKLWQTSAGRELLTLAKHGDRVRWLAFSPDGTLLATAGHDGILKIYRADKSEPRP